MHESLYDAARQWLSHDPDPATRHELQRLLDDDARAELEDRFQSRLEFGTAGLRGRIGAGPNRMNRALVRRVTAGLAAYLLRSLTDAGERGVVIGYDGRRMSPEFAEDAAGVLNGAGIVAHVFDTVATTPRIAYSVTALGAAAGIAVTASHNPPAYNGYKVYWENGAQIIPPHDRGISAAIDAAPPVPEIPMVEPEEADARGLLPPVPDSVGEAYIQAAADLCLHPEGDRGQSIIYSAMHGVGGADIRRVFDTAGFRNLVYVPEQAEPDGEFPTVEFPNPEEPGAMDLALALAEREDADLVLANDPDADRLAVILRRPQGSYQQLSGNEIGTMLGHYLLTQGSSQGTRLVATTIVSSSILEKMARSVGADYAETLTGFKWIANKALDRPDARFVFGFEEALGYTVGELVRDKDGVSAAVVFADMVGWCRSQGVHPLDYLRSIFDTFGDHRSAQHSLTLEGKAGAERIAAIMDRLRSQPPQAIAGSPVVRVADIQTGQEWELAGGTPTTLDLPASNVLRYITEDGTRVLVRPSGTEPKIKFYVESAGDPHHVLTAFVDDVTG